MTAIPFLPAILARRILPWRGAILGLLCALLTWGVCHWSMLRGLEDWLLDGCFALRGQRATSARVVLVDLDDASLDHLKKPAVYLSPELAEVVRFLDEQGAAAIGVDVLIPPSLMTLKALQPGGEGDATTLGAAIMDSRKVVLPEWHVGSQTARPLIQWQAKALDTPDPHGTDFGFVNLTEDRDQFVRRQQLAVPVEAKGVSYQLALALLAKARNAAVTWDPGSRQLLLGGESIPLDTEQMLRINYVGPPGTFPAVSLRQVLQAARQHQPMPEVRGAIVIIGSLGTGGPDQHNTPFSNRYADYFHRTQGGLMAGPEVHANTLATLHDRAFVTTPWWLASLPWFLILGAALGQAFLRVGLGAGFVLALVHHFGWKGVALLAFIYGNWRVEMGGMLLLGALTYAAAFALRWRVLRRVLRAVKSAPIAQALESDPGRLRLGGDARVVTVLFADIRSFTDFAERHTPAEVVALLNAYYAAVVPLLEAEGGVVDKFIGDGLMVLFGAIPERPDHSAAAVRAAQAMVRCVAGRRSTWAALGFDGFQIGIGIHTGPVVLGAVGTPTRLDFTAIGDTVNAAARVEGETKRLHTPILMTSATFAAVPPAERARLGIVEQAVTTTVKGKRAELQLHAVNGAGRAGA